MPCHVEQPWEIRTDTEQAARHMLEYGIPALRAKLDDLTNENDRLREVVLSLYEKGSSAVESDIIDQVLKDQVTHRKQDLQRIKRTLNAMLKKARAADPALPLEAQLGFHPDSI